MSEPTGSDQEAEEMILNFFLSDSSSDHDVPGVALNAQLAELKVDAYASRDTDDRTKDILHSLLLHLPDDGKKMLAGFIESVDDPLLDSVLFNLALHIQTAILMPMKNRSQTPVAESPFSGNQRCVNEIASDMVNSPTRAAQGELRATCLKRDAERCKISGIINKCAANLQSNRTVLDGDVEVAHIIPFSISKWDDEVQHERIVQIWATLRKCFPAISNYTPENINDPQNALILALHMHREFDEFRFCLEPTGVENEYMLENLSCSNWVARDFPLADELGRILISFRAYADIPLPSPQLLRIHAALARILHTSGMGKLIDEIFRDRAELLTLAEDGSSRAYQLLTVL